MPPPDGQKFVVKSVLKVQRLLLGVLRDQFAAELDQPFVNELYDRFKAHAQAVMRLSGYDFKTEQTGEFRDEATDVEELVRQKPERIPPFLELLSWHYGQLLTDARLIELSWRLAAGCGWMHNGGSLRKEFLELDAYWTPLFIEDIRYGPTSKKTGSPQLKLFLRVMDGPFAGLQFQQHIVVSWVLGYLAKSIGFPVFKSCTPLELVQCCFIGLLDTAEPRYPRIKEFHVTSAVLALNRGVRKMRAEPCPWDFLHACHDCPAGYAQQLGSCHRGAHLQTYVRRLCSQCKREAHIDTSWNPSICVHCLTNAGRKQKAPVRK